MTGNTRKKEPSQPDLFESVHPNTAKTSRKDYGEMYCDGASSGNPGDSGIGVVINLPEKDAKRSGKKKNYRISEYIGIATNNVAEYSALIRGLEKARALGLRRVKIFLDSELLVRQVNGIYKVKNKNLIPLWVRVMNILKKFDDYSIVHVRREMNKEADSLARQGIKKKRHKTGL